MVLVYLRKEAPRFFYGFLFRLLLQARMRCSTCCLALGSVHGDRAVVQIAIRNHAADPSALSTLRFTARSSANPLHGRQKQ